jgi:hypothetical protein
MDWQRTKCGTTAAPASQATMQRCMAVPHPHFDSDDEDLFPVSGKLKLLAGQGGAAAKADEDSEDELSPASSPVAAKKKRKTSSPGWGGARLKPCHTYAEALGPIQNTALTLRVWKSVDFKLRTRKQKLEERFAAAFGHHHYKPTMALALATFTNPNCFAAEPIVWDLVRPKSVNSRSISTQTTK